MSDFTNEEWRTIPGTGHYSVSNIGRLRSDPHEIFNKGNCAMMKVKGKILKLRKDKKGYLVTTGYINGKFKNIFAHSAVLLAFVGPRPKGMEVRHLNSNPLDNRLENLSYGTKSENMRDAVKLGTLVFSRTKLTREEVIAIGRDTRPITEISRAFGVCDATVINIKKGKSFKGFTDGIYYKPQKKRELTKEEMDFVLDRSNTREEVMSKIGITFQQVKRIRRTKKNVVLC